MVYMQKKALGLEWNKNKNMYSKVQFDVEPPI